MKNVICVISVVLGLAVSFFLPAGAVFGETGDPNEIARDPYPADGEINVATEPNLTLSWSHGDVFDGFFTEAAYIVHLDVNEANVANADPFIGEGEYTEATSYGVTNLEPETEYFWRIDTKLWSMRPPFTSKYVLGEVWSFTTMPEKAWDPDPADEAENLEADPNITLSWKIGDCEEIPSSIGYYVHYGTDFAEVSGKGYSDGLFVYGNTAVEIGPLIPRTTYYWRIDTTVAPYRPPISLYIYEGDVWSFTTRPPPPRVITVDNDGPADFNNIQAAIDDSYDGDTVLVADGIYTGDGNRDIDFHGQAITVKSENGAETCIIDCNGTLEELHHGFYFHNNEDANSVLDGLTVTNATRSGIMCLSASPTILNCIVIKNVGLGGGGIYTYDSSPIIVNCILAANQAADEGGAISCTGGAPSLTACLIVGNNSISPWGGAISCRADEIIIANCRIVGNGGSGVSCEIGRTHLINCVIVGNGAQYRGVGITCIGNWEPEVTITNCIIRNNISPSGDQISLTGWMNMLGEYFIPELSVSFSNVQDAGEAIGYYDIPQDLQGVHWGQGNIDAAPCFVDAGFWDPNGTPEDANDDFWGNGQGDYHLKSQAGRWDPQERRWTMDDETSPCIDGGDPMSPIGPEPFANGGIINMGAYGGTVEASKSYFGKAPCKTIIAGDVNGDCVIDFEDFRLMALHWCED